MIVYLGCYTDETHPNGLKALQLDEKSGAMAIVAEYPVSNALYQALSPDGKWLYSCTGEGLDAFRCQASGVGSQDVLDKCDDVKLGNCVAPGRATSSSSRPRSPSSRWNAPAKSMRFATIPTAAPSRAFQPFPASSAPWRSCRETRCLI